MPNELWTKPATELASMVRQGETSSREIVEAFLARIDAVNPALNAVTVTLADSARAEADEADRRRDAGEALGSLHGVPVTVKENIDLAGSATTQGLPAMAEAVPSTDSPHVARLREAGATPLARTNLPDFGLRWHTDNALRGATRNPWDAARTPGGSSGGEGAALAAGMTPLGLGNDYGGSLRWPAQANGICSLKPTFGRVPDHDANAPVEAPITIQLFAVQGPMARHVDDLRVAFNAMAGRDPLDPNSLPFEPTVPAPELGSRVALVPAPGTGDVDPEVAAGVERAGKALEKAGYAVELKSPPRIDDAYQLWRQLVVSEIRTAFLPQLGPLLSDDARQFLESVIELEEAEKGAPSLEGYMQGLAERNAIAREWAQFMEDYPLVVAPVCTQQPFIPGADIGGKDAVGPVVESMRMLVGPNLLGLPAAAVPVGVSEGLPQGVQVIGWRYQEAACLEAAAAIERALGTFTPIDPVT